jgi:hypothetical protein
MSRFFAVLFILAAPPLDAGSSTWTPSLPLQIFFAIAAPLGPIVFLAGLFLADARMTGWHAMAQRFAAKAPPQNAVNRWQDGGAGTIGLIRMKSLLRASVEEHGLYLAFPHWISFAHAPLLLPWSELHVTDDRTFLGVRVVTLHAGEPRIGRLVLRGGIAPDVVARTAKTTQA